MDQYLLESPYSQYDVLTSILAKSQGQAGYRDDYWVLDPSGNC